MRQVVVIVIRGVPTVLEVCFMCLFVSLSRILLHGSVSTNLSDPVKHQVDLLKVEVGIELLGNIHLVADIIPRDIHPSPLLALCPSVRNCFLVYVSLLLNFHSEGPSSGIRTFAGWLE